MKRIIRTLLPVLVVSLAAGPALADKLIVFKNGKVMRAKDVTPDGKWTYADLGKGATVGVRTSDIQSIEDSAGSSQKEEGYMMAATENRGVSRDSGGRADRRGSSRRNRSSSVQERIEQRQRELEEQRKERRDQRDRRNKQSRDRSGANGLRPLQPFNQRNVRNSGGFRRSRMPGGFGQRVATDQRVVRPSDNDDEEQ